MKKVFTDTIAELKEMCNNELSFVLVIVFAVSSFFTKFSIANESCLIAIVDLTYFFFSVAGLSIVLILFLSRLEEYLTARSAKNVRHASIKLIIIMQIISLILVIISITTGHIYAAEVSVWFVTGVAMRLIYN